jgi:hypothetical protein
MDEQITLDRFLSRVRAILKDPEKQEIAPPATSKARKLPVAVPMLGILIVGLVGRRRCRSFLANGDKQPTVAADPAAAEAAATAAAATEAARRGQSAPAHRRAEVAARSRFARPRATSMSTAISSPVKVLPRPRGRRLDRFG